MKTLKNILHEITQLEKSYRDKGFYFERDTLQIIGYTRADIEYAKSKAILEVVEIIKKHLYENDESNKCSDCSRRKFYQSGYKDGKKENDDWIPVNPDNIPDTEVLCCDKYGEMLIGYLSNTEEEYVCESDECIMYDVVAWMNKPKSYKPNE